MIWLRQLSLIIAIGIVKFIANLVPEKAKGTAGYHYPAAFVFLLIIAVALYAQVKVCPYAYRLQNNLEAFLMLANVFLLLFAIACQAISDSKGYADTSFSGITSQLRIRGANGLVPPTMPPAPPPPHPGYRDPNEGGFFAEHWLEVVMVLILAFSLLFTIGCLVYDVILARAELNGLDPSMVIAASDHFIDAPIEQCLLSKGIRPVSYTHLTLPTKRIV